MIEALAELCLRRIDHADEIRIVSEDGCLGSAKRREIQYAARMGKSFSAVEADLRL